MSKLTTKWKELSKQRKKRAIPEGLTTKQAIGGWNKDKDFTTTLHKVAAARVLPYMSVIEAGLHAWLVCMIVLPLTQSDLLCFL